jgi:ATP-binding cassette subfamily F protein 3
MIRFQNVSLMRGTKPLLEDADLTLNPGDKIGLIGANGAGKSSLFAMLRGELHPDQGAIDFPAKWRMAYVAQETPALDRPALEYAIDGDVNLRRLQAELIELEAHPDVGDHGMRLGELHSALADADAYTVQSRGEQLLLGLGFSLEQMAQPVASFSGGWRMRLNLAQALMCPSDLLLLDEPTNHLDLETREALTMALAQFEGTVVLVSHDRHLLRATTDEFIIVADGKLQPFDGDLDDYKEWLFQTKLGKGTDTLPAPAPAKDGKLDAPMAAPVDRKEQKKLEAEARQRMAALRKPIENRVKRLEEQMAKLNAKKAEIDAQLLEPSIYEAENKEKLKLLVADQAFAARDLEQLESEWLELQEQLEGLAA